MPIYYTDPKVRKFRQRLRNSATPTEVRLWSYLRSRRLRGFKFRRQHSVGRFVLDFYCSQLRLGVEVDGGGHFTTRGQEYDAARDAWLQHFRIQVVRIPASEVNENIEGVVEYLGEVVDRRFREIQ